MNFLIVAVSFTQASETAFVFCVLLLAAYLVIKTNAYIYVGLILVLSALYLGKKSSRNPKGAPDPKPMTFTIFGHKFTGTLSGLVACIGGMVCVAPIVYGGPAAYAEANRIVLRKHELTPEDLARIEEEIRLEKEELRIDSEVRELLGDSADFRRSDLLREYLRAKTSEARKQQIIVEIDSQVKMNGVDDEKWIKLQSVVKTITTLK